MNRFIMLFPAACLIIAPSLAQQFDARNYMAQSFGAVAARTSYFKVDATGELLTGTISSKEGRKAVQLFLAYEAGPCVAYTSKKLRKAKSKELYELRGLCHQ